MLVSIKNFSDKGSKYTISVREAKYGERHKGSNYGTFEYEEGNIYFLEIYIAFFPFNKHEIFIS